MADDYEILSHSEVERLRKGLKGARSAGSDDLKRSLDHLSDKLDSMIDVFEAASEDLREEDTESELISEKIDPIIERLKTIEDQNQKLADGIVAINSIVDEKLDQIFDIANSLRQSQMMLQRNLEDAVNKIKSSVSESRSMSSMHSSLPPMEEPEISSDLPPLPKSPGLEKLKPRKKGLKLF